MISLAAAISTQIAVCNIFTVSNKCPRGHLGTYCRPFCTGSHPNIPRSAVRPQRLRTHYRKFLSSRCIFHSGGSYFLQPVYAPRGPGFAAPPDRRPGPLPFPPLGGASAARFCRAAASLTPEVATLRTQRTVAGRVCDPPSADLARTPHAAACDPRACCGRQRRTRLRAPISDSQPAYALTRHNDLRVRVPQFDLPQGAARFRLARIVLAARRHAQRRTPIRTGSAGS